MKCQKVVASALVFASVLAFGSPASALTQREQQQAAQRAYEASARDHNEAAAGFTRAREIAEAVRDTSAEFLRNAR